VRSRLLRTINEQQRATISSVHLRVIPRIAIAATE